jgi:hypothetical protein
VEALGCSAEMELFRDRYEIPQMAKFHDCIVPDRHARVIGQKAAL